MLRLVRWLWITCWYKLCYNWICKTVPADEALERQVVFVTVDLVFLIVLFSAVVFSTSCFPFQLPSQFVIRTVMKKLTAVCDKSIKCFDNELEKFQGITWESEQITITSLTSKTTKARFFVIFAYVGLIIPSHCRSEIGWCSDRTFTYHSTGCISRCGVFLFVILRIVI